MKTVIMKTISAGPEGVRHLSSRHTLPDFEADLLVQSGNAEYADEPVPVASDPAPEEKAVVAPKETRGGRGGKK